MNSILKLLLHMLVYPASFLAGRRRLTWVFGAPDDQFAGNSKYLYLWVSEYVHSIEAVWITGSSELCATLAAHGLRSAMRWSVEGMKLSLTASHYFVNSNGDDINFALSGGARIFNLWHGVGIKNILRKSKIGRNSNLFRFRWIPLLYIRSIQRFARPSFVLSTSPEMARHFSECFGIPVDKCPQIGYPRQDPSFDEAFRRVCLALESSQFQDDRARFRRIYVYAPTLRQSTSSFLDEALPDFARLSRALDKTDALLFLKLHPRDADAIHDLDSKFENIKPWPADADFYSHIRDIDCLITDYSSIFYDYIELKDTGVIIYSFDYARFIIEERDLALPFHENVLGIRANDFAQLCAAIEADAAAQPLNQANLQRIRRLFWNEDVQSRRPASARLVEFLSATDAAASETA